MDKIQEEFECWLKSGGNLTIKDGDGEYSFQHTRFAFEAWKASRATLFVELPDGSLNGLEGDSFHGYMCGVEAVSACLDDAGVRYE